MRIAASLAKSFAIDACRVKRSPRSFSVAARSAMRRAASSSVALSASIHWMAWKSAMGRPKAWRSLAYVVAASSAALADADGLRSDPDSSAVERHHRDAEAHPGLAEQRASSGSRHSSKVSGTVLEPRSPILSSGAADDQPRCVLFDEEAGNPLRPRAAGPRPHHHHAGVGAVGDPLLLAVEHPAVVALPRGGPHAARVAADRRAR